MSTVIDKQAYPLEWPEGWPRTEGRWRQSARYQVSFARARDDLLHELELLDQTNEWAAVLSTNVALRRDNLPYANQKGPEDCGVAVYFMRNGKPHVMACDVWDKVKDNLRAIGLSIAALRAMERAGASGILDRAYSGFEALPAPGRKRSWREVLECLSENDIEAVRRHYKRLVQRYHPDKGDGDHAKFQEIQQAWKEAQEALG